MAQHDMVIANGAGASVRSDLNNALAALVSSNSGAVAPSPTFAGQVWIDTANSLLKLRNLDNDAWITLCALDFTADTADIVRAGTSVTFTQTITFSGLVALNRIKGYIDEAPAQVDSGTAATLPAYSNGNVYRYRLTGNANLTLPAAPATANTELSIIVEIVQDGTGGRTLAFTAPSGGTIEWHNSATMPAVNATLNKETHYAFRVRGGTTKWYGSQIHKAS